MRPRYVSAASRPVTALATAYAMLLWSSRTATKPTRRAHAVTPPSVAALPIPKHEACTSRVRSGLQGPSLLEVAGPLPSHERTATVASGSSACSVSERTTIHGEHAYDPSPGCWLLMASEPLWSWWWWWPLMPNLAGPGAERVSEASEAIIKPRSLAALQAPSKPP